MKDVAVKESAIFKQIEHWRRQKAVVGDKEKANILPFVTISREYGCGGFDLAVKLSDILNNEAQRYISVSLKLNYAAV